MALNLTDFASLSNELTKAMEWRRTIYISDVFEDGYGENCFTIGYGEGPHYEETIACFYVMNDNEAELIAKALQLFVNHHQEILHLAKIGQVSKDGYPENKDALIEKLLDSQREVLKRLL